MAHVWSCAFGDHLACSIQVGPLPIACPHETLSSAAEKCTSFGSRKVHHLRRVGCRVECSEAVRGAPVALDFGEARL